MRQTIQSNTIPSKNAKKFIKNAIDEVYNDHSFQSKKDELFYKALKSVHDDQLRPYSMGGRRVSQDMRDRSNQLLSGQRFSVATTKVGFDDN